MRLQILCRKYYTIEDKFSQAKKLTFEKKVSQKSLAYLEVAYPGVVENFLPSFLQKAGSIQEGVEALLPFLGIGLYKFVYEGGCGISCRRSSSSRDCTVYPRMRPCIFLQPL